ncbi:MAG: hypothetical protein ACRYGP_16850 [Janthinobacterium lividum]
MADEVADENKDENWTVMLDSVGRIESMDTADDDGDLFSVDFKASAPNLTADFEVLVSDVADEAQIVSEAFDTLQDGLERWAQVLARRPGAEKVEPKGE